MSEEEIEVNLPNYTSGEKYNLINDGAIYVSFFQ